MPRVRDRALLENVEILFRNFRGEKDDFNPLGKMTFAVLLDEETAESMGRDGWNVKHLKAREEGDIPQAYIPVEVSYKSADKGGRPPEVVMITSRGKTNIPREMIKVLDYVDIKTVDVLLQPYNWDVQGNQGVKAYLWSIYVTIIEDPLQLKYQDVKSLDGPVEQLAITSGDEEFIEGEVVEEELTDGPPF